MKIAIIGAGNVGGTLGKAWAKKGHQVFFGVRHPDDDKVRDLLKAIGNKAQAGSLAEAARFGEVVVLATPWRATQAAIQSAGNLAGKIVSTASTRSSPISAAWKLATLPLRQKDR